MLGRLATEPRVSKSGVFAHLGSKEELRLATIRAARAIFRDEVTQPAGRHRARHRAAAAALRLLAGALGAWRLLLPRGGRRVRRAILARLTGPATAKGRAALAAARS